MSVDANMELAEEEDKFDVFGYLKKLRQSRKGLVDNVVSTISPSGYMITDILERNYSIANAHCLEF